MTDGETPTQAPASTLPAKGTLMQGKRGVIMGVANARSLAWGIAAACAAQGAELAFTYQGDALEKRVRPLAQGIGATLILPCDVSDDASIDSAFAAIREAWGEIDFVVHAIGFADKQYLRGRYVDTPRAAFLQAMDISCFSFTDVARRAAEHPGPLVHVARDDARMARLAEALAFFLPDAEILRFPAWDCLPYDRVSPNPELVSERIATLARPGDLLFYAQFGHSMPAHVMIWLGPSQIAPDANDWVLYHTGPGGEIRKVQRRDLLAHPSPAWRPVDGNSNFLGVRRLNLLSDNPQ